MKKLFTFFGPFLTILLGFSLVSLVAIPLLGFYTEFWEFSELYVVLGKYLTFIIIVAFFLSTLYLIIGLTKLILASTKKQNDTNERSNARSLILRGIIGGVISFLFFFILQVELGFFGLSFNNSSFSGETLVMTPQGNTRIAELREGSQVLSYNIETNLLETASIEVFRAYNTAEYFLVNNNLKVTAEHPFAVWQHGTVVWKPVKELARGDALVTNDKDPMIIETIEKKKADKPITVYNPQVSGQHNYFVLIGNTAVLVHNKLPTLPDEE